MGELGRGSRELLFARSELCQNSAPTIGSLSCQCSFFIDPRQSFKSNLRYITVTAALHSKVLVYIDDTTKGAIVAFCASSVVYQQYCLSIDRIL